MDTPPPKAVQAALRKTTEALALELAQPGEAAPDWSSFEWLIARAVVAMHGVSPLLSDALRWEGPPGWRDFLLDQKAQTQARHARIQELLQRIDSRACSDGICMVALKGAELHARGLYAPGERPMADVDLLVRHADTGRATQMIEALGFHESFSTWKHRVFVPLDDRAPAGLGEHAGNYVKIELHERLREALPVDTEDITGSVFPARGQPGLNPYPSRTALMLHLLLHAAGAMVFRALRLLHLHDLALLSARMTDEDWRELLMHRGSARGPWWALPPLALTARYYQGAVPTHVSAALAPNCPPLLRSITRRRTLSDVSLSHLWIDAFPGIEWSQSPLQMTRYVMSRVRPSKETLAMRGQLVRTQIAASLSRWDHLSQGRRMLVWLTSRPARAETMHPVRMALAQAQ